MPIQGKYQAVIDARESDATAALTAIAHLTHEQFFDPVSIEEHGISGTEYEARWSESCELCSSIWIGTKAGEVVCVDLAGESPRSMTLLLDGGVRTLLHLHGPNAFGADHTLLVGTDEGFLHIVHDVGRELVETAPPLHVESLRANPLDRGAGDATSERNPMSQAEATRRARLGQTKDPFVHDAGERSTVGITAIARLRKGQSGASPIIVATRRGALFLLDADARSREPRLRLMHTLSGWVQWMVDVPNRDQIACISRGGELCLISTADPATWIKTEQLPLLPTAAAPFLDGFLLGTSEGLVYWSERAAEPAHPEERSPCVVSLPVTRSPVLCLDRVTMHGDDKHGGSEPHEYVILGLGNGRLRVVRQDLLRGLAERRPVLPTARARSIDLGSAVLAVEVMKPKGDELSSCYLLVAQRDHALRLFHIDSPRQVVDSSKERRRQLITKIGEANNRQIAEAMLSAAKTPSDHDAIWYFVVLAVQQPSEEHDWSSRAWLLEEMPRFLKKASPALLRLIALDLYKLAGRDPDTLLEISLALLQALPRRHTDWRRVTEQHLKVLNDAASDLKPEGTGRLIAWARFVRKYVLLGHTFSEKKVALRSLIRMNYRTHKYVDAFVYLALLFERRYDLEWQAEIDGEIHSLHSTASLVIAVTRAGALWFFSRSGRRLRAVSAGVESRRVSIGIDGGHVLACVVTEGGDSTHLVVSWSSPFAVHAREPGLSAFEIKHVVGEASPAREQVTVQRSAVKLEATAQSQGAIAIHSLCIVPKAEALLLAGLDDAAYHFGILKRVEGAWSLRLVKHTNASEMPRSEPSKLASGKMPSRAIAASCLDERGDTFLAAVGSDSGQVSFVWFDITCNASDATTESFPGPITAIDLAGRDGASRSEDGARDCYIGTATGETFAGSVPVKPGPGAPFWRETHDSSVVAIRRWSTTLYAGGAGARQVVVTATEKGRICFHEAHEAPSDTAAISPLNNYVFRGQRLDQVSLPSTLRHFRGIPGTSTFLAAGPSGKIYKGSFCFTHSWRDLADSEPVDDLPFTMWGAFDKIRQSMIRYERFFFPPRQDRVHHVSPDDRERAILGLIQLENGAVRRYLLDRQLIGAPLNDLADERRKKTIRQLWSRDGGDIGVNFRDRLADLRAESREDRHQIKIIVKSLGRAFVDRRLESILHDAESNLSAAVLDESLQPAHAGVLAAVEALTGRILDASRNPTSAAGRIRSATFKELFRVQVFRHLALERGEGRPIRGALVAAINSCLRDDDILVRVEVLRTIGITLRNIGVLCKRLSPPAEERLKEHLFPNGVDEMLWLVRLLTENLERYTDFSVGTPHATTWYYLSAFQPIFLLFSESTLRLCDVITRGGVPILALEVIAKKLRGKVGGHVRRLIEELYLVPCLGAGRARQIFLDNYTTAALRRSRDKELARRPARPQAVSPHATAAEERVAARLSRVYNELARFWEVEKSVDLANLLIDVEFDASQAPEREAATDSASHGESARSPLGQAQELCQQLAELALKFRSPCDRDMADDRAKFEAIAALQTTLKGEAYKSVLQPVRSIADSILVHWQSFYAGKLPSQGSAIAGYTLGRCLGEGGYGRVYVGDPAPGKDRIVTIKIFRHTHDPQGRKKEQFLLAAEDNKKLSGKAGTRGVMPLGKIIKTPHPCYIMPHREGNLEEYSKKNAHLRPGDRHIHAVSAARDLGAGLSAAHRRGLTHGDVKASNILVYGDDAGVLQFELADFAMKHSDRAVDGTDTISVPPPSIDGLSSRRSTSGELDDACALAWVLYRVFFPAPLPRLLPKVAVEKDFHSACRDLASIKSSGDPHLRQLIAALTSMFDGTCQDARTFLDAIAPRKDSDPPPPPPSSAPPPLPFSHDEILGFVPPLLVANVAPATLFTSMPPGIVGHAEMGKSTQEVFFADLHLLNSLAWPWPAGVHPMVIWLKNAFARLVPRPEALIYADALRRFGVNVIVG